LEKAAGSSKIVEKYVVQDNHPAVQGGTYHVYKMATKDRVHVNLEDLPVRLHASFVKNFVTQLSKTTDIDASPPLIQFNHVSENVYRYFLNMAVRKLGYRSLFTRYNGELGMATFERQKNAWDT